MRKSAVCLHNYYSFFSATHPLVIKLNPDCVLCELRIESLNII